MMKQSQCNIQLLAAAIMLLLLTSSARSEMMPTVQNVYDDLIQAVQKDDNVAYRAAQSAALQLQGREFDVLLESLDKTGTWQALALKGGLRVRRENPEMAVAFDERLDWLRNNPMRTRIGTHEFPSWRFREEFATPEGDWLRYEAVLTEKAELPTDLSGYGMQLPGWIAFRRCIFTIGYRPNIADDMRFLIKMIRDTPEWLPQPPAWALRDSIQRSAHKVDEYVPELVGHYKRLRHTQGRTMFIFVGLIRAIAEADAEVALPALKQILEFERTTGEEIQSQASALRARLQEVEELHTQAMREGREEDARKLAMERRELRARDVSLDSSQLRRVRTELDELIKKHQKAAEG